MAVEKLIIVGALASDGFPGWIIDRGRKLGLRGGILEVSEHAIETVVAGPVELIDAMEVGCSLGPTSVEVECIHRSSVDFTIANDTFAYIVNE